MLNVFRQALAVSAYSIQQDTSVSTQDLTLHPISVPQAVERFNTVNKLYNSGSLTMEVERMGVNPRWLDRVFSRPPVVGISEQSLPLTTIFGKLGQYGSPAALKQALISIGQLSSMLDVPEVSTGMLCSRNHLVTKRGITSGFYLLVEDQDSKVGKIEKVRFFTNKENADIEGFPYHAIKVSATAIKRFQDSLCGLFECSFSQLKRAAARFHKQDMFLEESRQEGREVTEEMTERHAQNYLQQIGKMEVSKGLRKLLEIAQKAKSEVETDSFGAYNYCELIASFNRKLVSVILPEMNFNTYWSDDIDALATYGVQDWQKFLGAFFEYGLLDRQEPVLKHHTQSGEHEMLFVKNLEEGIVGNKSGTRCYSINALVEESRASVDSGSHPTLLPIATMRYWAMYAVGNGIVLEDGMPYEKLSKLHAVMTESDLPIVKRALTIFPYTGLTGYEPEDPEKPYAGLTEEFVAIDYLTMFDS